MKRAILVILLLASATIIYAQQRPPKTPKDPDYEIIPEPSHDTVPKNGVYRSVEHEPVFRGGWKAFYKFLAKNLKYPKTNIDVQGKVFVQFIVEKNGSLSDIHVIRGLAAEFDAEAIRVMKLSPRWAPGLQKGKPVRVQYNIPINFSIQ